MKAAFGVVDIGFDLGRVGAQPVEIGAGVGHAARPGFKGELVHQRALAAGAVPPALPFQQRRHQPVIQRRVIVTAAQHQAVQLVAVGLGAGQRDKGAHAVPAQHQGAGFPLADAVDHPAQIVHHQAPAVLVGEVAGRVGGVHAGAMAAMVGAVKVPAVLGQGFAQGPVAGAVLGHAVQPDQRPHRVGGAPLMDGDGMAVAGADNKTFRSH